MIRRGFNLHFLSALLILVFNSVFITFAQNKTDEPKPTETEKRDARKIAVEFALQFSHTKKFSYLVKNLFADDFVEQYKTLILKGIDEDDEEVSFNPIIRIKTQTLKSLSNEDWKRLYISTNNFFLLEMLVITEAESRGKASDDYFDKMFPAKLKKLFAENPNLVGLIEDDLEKSKPVESKKELMIALNTLETGTNIFNNAHRDNLNENKAKELFNSFENREQSKTWLEISDENRYLSLTKGTRIIFVVSPLAYALALTRKNGKMKIILAGVYDE